ncbi:30S ribosomal protein S4e [Methanocella sp. CWC-04]|uniref:Small ribosomal subunit protein eS4 n=1 Tax=Methanooceanicella nereidis TaxID=2052831 RepID=A0AAP2W5V4_9EURY|nr:30S ribosomal protein S4e [Methanocella sp. CWC-04]MCD1293501.1 30S ribosomal protein S4e [Methanocella sp. CWC-04]
MAGKHLKRVAAPRKWPITRKTSTWVAKPTPGAHSEENGMPLLIVLRDILGLADKSKEIKQILHEGKVLVDGKVRKDHRFIVGMFDVITIPALELSYRVMIGGNGKLKLVKVTDAGTKLCKIVNKTAVKGGKIQLNFHDGTTMLASNDFHTKDSVLLSVPEKKITEHLPYNVGSFVMVVDGKHAGTLGTVKNINVVKSSSANTVTIEGKDGQFDTIEDYIFVVGKDSPVLELGVKA